MTTAKVGTCAEAMALALHCALPLRQAEDRALYVWLFKGHFCKSRKLQFLTNAYWGRLHTQKLHHHNAFLLYTLTTQFHLMHVQPVSPTGFTAVDVCAAAGSAAGLRCIDARLYITLPRQQNIVMIINDYFSVFKQFITGNLKSWKQVMMMLKMFP